VYRSSSLNVDSVLATLVHPHPSSDSLSCSRLVCVVEAKIPHGDAQVACEATGMTRGRPAPPVLPGADGPFRDPQPRGERRERERPGRHLGSGEAEFSNAVGHPAAQPSAVHRRFRVDNLRFWSMIYVDFSSVSTEVPMFDWKHWRPPIA